MKLGISQREFARREGVSEALVRRKVKSGHLIPYPDKTLNPDLVGTGWHEHTAEEKAEAQAEADFEAGAIPPKAVSEAKKEHYLALLRQLEYDLKVKEVVLIEDVTRDLGPRLLVVRNRLLAIPARAAPRLAITKNPAECQAIVSEYVNEALAELSRGGREMAAKYLASGDPRAMLDEVISHA